MTKPRDPDALLSAYLAVGMEVLPDRVVDSVLDEVHRTRQRRVLLPARRSRPMSRTTLAAAVVVAVVALGGAFFVVQRRQPAVGVPVPTASASTDPSLPAVVVAPSPTATATPSPTPPPIVWTPASLNEDWPAPVRAEPAGGAIVVSLKDNADDAIPDPLGDTESTAHPWVDIKELRGGGARIIINLGSHPPLVAPTEQWIAYGVVVDDDRDGIPDRRFGIDNIPGTAPGKDNHRAWITDLHTGRTVAAAVGAPYDAIVETKFDTKFDTFFPDPRRLPHTGAWLQFGGAYAGGGGNPGLVDPFYAWASVVENGRVVATDYAPDVGWYVEPESAPEAEPTPVPGPTPQVKDDPDVPGGRLWTTTVVNNSQKQAKLYVAEEDGSGAMGRLVGTVTPNVVPPDTTMKVIFHLPAIGGNRWWIFVNPGPDPTFLVNSTDVPAYGEFRIGADGKAGWRSLIP